MSDFLDKLIIEEQDLREKIEKLKDVIDNEFYPTHTKYMRIQIQSMRLYRIALLERIDIELQTNK